MLTPHQPPPTAPLCPRRPHPAAPRPPLRRAPAVATVAAAAIAACAMLGAFAAPASAAPPAIVLPTRTVTLENGLRVVLVPDRSSPTISIAVYVDVGSRDEAVGRTGFAHLFEHMMFQGSANMAKGEYFHHITRNGGTMNGTTNVDRTNYFATLPSDRLELAMWLESDRLHSLAITLENFENQREVVKEERRLRVDNVPYTPARLAHAELAYDNFAYAHSVIGSMDDLDAAPLEDVQAFFDTWYTADNIVLGLAGDFDEDEALLLVRAWFGTLRRGPGRTQVAIDEPALTQIRSQTIDDPLAPEAAAYMSWQIPPSDHADTPALMLLGYVLAGGESSRLHRRLVRDEEIALRVGAGTGGRRGPDLFNIEATARGVDGERLRAVVLDEVGRLVAEGIDDREVDAARQRVYRERVGQLESTLGRVHAVTSDLLFFGDPTYRVRQLDAIAALTAADVQRVAERYLHADRYVVTIVRPGAAQGGAQ